MRVSVIIPAYNSEATIERCVKSVLDQDYQDLEILIVDDGSEDGTASICRKLMALSGKIRLINAEHAGVSHARNKGLDNLSGDYVMFADADDRLEKNCISRMVDAIETASADMAICSYTRIIYGKDFPVEKLQKNGIISIKRYIENTLKDPGHHYFGVLWNKIFKREIIEKNKVRFREDISLGEDFVFSLDYLKAAGKVNVIGDRLYKYCYQERSTLSRVHNKTIDDCRIEMANRIKIFDNYLKTLKTVDLYNKRKKRAFHYWIVFYIRQLYGIRNEYKWNDEEKESWKKELFSNDYIRKAVSLFSDFEIAAEYCSFAFSQDIKNFLKMIFRSFRKRGL